MKYVLIAKTLKKLLGIIKIEISSIKDVSIPRASLANNKEVSEVSKLSARIGSDKLMIIDYDDFI